MTRKSNTARRPTATVASARKVQSLKSGVLLPAMAAAIGLWAAFPPLGWGWLAWVAPIGLLVSVEREQPVGRGGYVSLWLAGCLFWLAVLHGIRLAFWPLIFGWLALSLYLAVYFPVFVAVARVLRWSWRWPLEIAAPVAWLGLELIRSYILTGYAANTLAHTQAHFPLVIQIADQLGGGGISFLIVTVAAAILRTAQHWNNRAQPSWSWSGALWAGMLVGATLAYGWWRLAEADRNLAQSPPLLRVLLVQENTPSVFDGNTPESTTSAWNRYLELTRSSAAAHAPIDLVVWPESTFTAGEPWYEAQLTGDVSDELKRRNVDKTYLLQIVSQMQEAFRDKARRVISAVRIANDSSSQAFPYLLMGSDTVVYRSDGSQQFNSAMFIGPDGELLDRYGKMHLVMFGEYIPLGPLLQWLRDLVGLPGIDAGTEVKSFQLNQVRVSPSICFESMMPRLLQWQVRTLSSAGSPPDVLINVTNDSWFRGSTMLDHHLACSMLCAVENRRPLLVAANTGLSAHIDGSGRLIRCSTRSAAEAILAEPQVDARWGLVQSAGYPLSWLCALLVTAAVLPRRLVGLPRHTRQPTTQRK